MRDPVVWLLATALVIAFGFVIVLARRAPDYRGRWVANDESAPQQPKRTWLRIEIAHTLTFAALPLRIRHEIAPNSIQDVFEDAERLVSEYFERLRAHEQIVPDAQPLTMPPEPEERIARDLKHAKAISRGAQALMDAARAQGLTLTHDQALAEAATMYTSRLENP